MELLGGDDGVEEGTEIVFFSFGEAVLRHKLGLFFGYVQEIIVGGLGDAQDRIIRMWRGLAALLSVGVAVLRKGKCEYQFAGSDPPSRDLGQKHEDRAPQRYDGGADHHEIGDKISPPPTRWTEAHARRGSR